MGAAAAKIRNRMATLADILSVPGGIGVARRAPRRSLSSAAIVGRVKAMGIAPATILDVGANRGQFTSACLGYFPDAYIIAFEAIPELCNDLEALFGPYPKVRVMATALGSRRERRRFQVNEYSPSSSFLPLSQRHQEAYAHATKTNDIEVDIMPLDEAVEVAALAAPILLKLDVQGFEMEVLKGARDTLARVDHVLLETSFHRMYEGEPLFDDYARFLGERGFRSLGPVGFLPDPSSGVINQMDMVFARDVEAAPDR